MSDTKLRVYPNTPEYRIANAIAYRYFNPHGAGNIDTRFYSLREDIYRALLALNHMEFAA